MTHRRILYGTVVPVPALDLNFTSGVFDSRVVFTRASTATYINSTGLLATAASGSPRFVYDPLTLAPLGYLSETTSTNIHPHSQFDSGWNLLGGTLTASNATSPDGTLDAATFTEDTTTGNHGFYYAATVPITANTIYTASIYLKAGTRSTVTLSFENAGPTDAIRCNVDLSAGTVSAGSVVGTGTLTGTPQIQKLLNGWYRVFLAGTINAASTQAFLIPYGGNPAGTISYTGTSKTFFAFGADVKIGADYSAYIATTTVSVTRQPDVATITLSTTSIPANPSALTIISKFMSPLGYSAVNPHGVYQIDDGTTNNRILFRFTNGGSDALQLFAIVGGVTQSTLTLNAAPATATSIRSWVALAPANSAAQAIGQTKQTTAAAAPLTTGYTTLRIGNANNAILIAPIARLQIYNSRLLDAQAATIAIVL